MKASEFKAKCLGVLDDVERTGETVLVLKRGRVVARVVSPRVGTEGESWRSLRGDMEVVGDIISPPLPASDWESTHDEGS